MLKSEIPDLVWKYPIEPVHALRGAPSISLIAAIDAVFGQPVIEPPGNNDDRIVPNPIPGFSLPETPLTKCCTVGNASIRKSDQYTLPGSHIFERSCFFKSTNIKCSAISFLDDTISICKSLSSSTDLPLG